MRLAARIMGQPLGLGSRVFNRPTALGRAPLTTASRSKNMRRHCFVREAHASSATGEHMQAHSSEKPVTLQRFYQNGQLVTAGDWPCLHCKCYNNATAESCKKCEKARWCDGALSAVHEGLRKMSGTQKGQLNDADVQPVLDQILSAKPVSLRICLTSPIRESFPVSSCHTAAHLIVCPVVQNRYQRKAFQKLLYQCTSRSRSKGHDVSAPNLVILKVLGIYSALWTPTLKEYTQVPNAIKLATYVCLSGPHPKNPVSVQFRAEFRECKHTPNSVLSFGACHLVHL